MILLTAFISFLVNIAVAVINVYKSLSIDISGRRFSLFWVLMGLFFVDWLLAVFGDDSDG